MTKSNFLRTGVMCSLLTGGSLLGTAMLSTHRGPFAYFSELYPDLANDKIPATGIGEIEGFFKTPKTSEEASDYAKLIGFECVVQNRVNAPEYFETRKTLIAPDGRSLKAPSSPANTNISENHYCEYQFGPLLGTGQRWVLSFDIDFNKQVHEAKSYLLCDICP